MIITINNIQIKTNYPTMDSLFEKSIKNSLNKGMAAGSFRGYWWIKVKINTIYAKS